jgi:SAM-dependent methyltransferase
LSATPDFGALAPSYDRLRPQDDNWHELLDVLVREGDLAGHRVLEIGAGTGALAAALAARGAKVWALDASPEMLEVARGRLPRAARARLGRAEELPFKDGWFERAVGRLVVHLVDRPLAFAELRRVLAPGGRATLATFAPSHFDEFWLGRIFPSLEAIDRERFPSGAEVEEQLVAAGFERVRLVRHSQSGRVEREQALAKLRGRYISTLHLLDEAEFRAGVERAERELPDVLEFPLEWLIAVADR